MEGASRTGAPVGQERRTVGAERLRRREGGSLGQVKRVRSGGVSEESWRYDGLKI